MPIKEINDMKLMLTDGEIISDINDVYELAEKDIESNNFQTNQSISLSVNADYSGDIQEIMQSPDVSDFKITMMSPVGVKQARKHKKKRINKKWLKRYGLVPIYRKIVLPECSIEQDDDCHFTLIRKDYK